MFVQRGFDDVQGLRANTVQLGQVPARHSCELAERGVTRCSQPAGSRPPDPGQLVQ